MTVAANSRRREYQGNGVTTIFNGPSAYGPDEITAFLFEGDVSTPVSPDDYQVSNFGRESGTRVEMAVPPSSGQTLVLLRTVPYSQNVDITNQGAFLPEVVEKGYDNVVFQTQQLADAMLRSLRFPDNYPVQGVSSDMPLPLPGRALVWNEDGTRLVNGDIQLTGDMLLRPALAQAGPGKGASLVGFLQAGTGAVARTIEDRMRDAVSAKDFGAVGDGAADNTAAIQAAVEYALLVGSHVYWPAGNYFVAGNIAGFHSVRHAGPGIIVRGGESWAVDPRNEGVRRIYVSPTGDDANDGLSPDFPMRTGTKVTESIKRLGPSLSGDIEIVLAAGDYPPFVFSGKFGNTGVVTLRGPDVALNTQPTAIIRQSMDPGGVSGISVSGYQRVTLKNVMSEGFSSSGRAGIRLRNLCNVSLINVWDDGSYYGYDVQGFVKYSVSGGQVQNNVMFGVMELFGVSRSYQGQTLADGFKVLNCAGTGFQAKEGCVGHMDYITIDGCTISCVEFQSGGTANVKAMSVDNAPVGFLIANCELHNMQGVTFGPGITHNVKRLGAGYEISQYGWTGAKASATAIETGFSPLVLIGTPVYVAGNITGTTPVDYTIGTLLAKRYNAKGQRARVVVRGAVRGANLVASAQINLVIGGSALGAAVNIPAGTVENSGFTLEYELITTDNGNAQLACAELRGEGGTFIDVQHATRSFDLSIDVGVVARVTLGNSGDSLQILSAELFG